MTAAIHPGASRPAGQKQPPHGKLHAAAALILLDLFRKNYFTYSTVYSKPYSSCSFLTAGSQSSMKVGA
mgnify:CR=1 FL=1